MNIINRLVKSDCLPRLVQTDNFIGWIFRIDYEQAFVMTNDIWKAKVGGVPHNCFLIATAFNPDKYAEAHMYEKEIVLLRVIGSSKLPMEDDLVRTKIEHFQEQQDARNGESLDDLTRNQLQFSGLECRVLGTFYTDDDGRLLLGSDIETYHTAVRLQVYKPVGDALATMVNYISPVRENAAREEAERMGLQNILPSFPIGSVRYTSTQRLQRELNQDGVIFNIQSVDFLARRTGVFGMTRTGKSNMIKQLVSVVKRTADDTGMKIGQIIYDLNGEYANANQQDAGSSLSDVYPESTERYRLLEAPGFHLIRNNFYLQIPEGFSIIQQILRDRMTPSADLKQFLEVSFDEPDSENRGEHNRWEVKRAIYQAVLYKAGFPLPQGFQISFPLNDDVDRRVRQSSNKTFPEKNGRRLTLSPQQAVDWLIEARTVNRQKDDHDRPLPLLSCSGGDWFDEDAVALLNMLAQKNNNNSYITGYKHIAPLKEYHSESRRQDVSEEIYKHLLDGKIVILDLSVGNPEHRERLSKVIARHIFNRSMGIFNCGAFAPNIVIYIEEAHNLMGKKDDITDVWPRIAKEGAKCRIATVYSTQEVSSIHPNILSNTENIFVSHLNNEGEIKELSKFYDFSDFSKSLIRAQDVGFDRIKTLSSPFVVPVQIHKFDPEAEKVRTKK
ncbi:MAG: DUF87 domain-containing protein [Candidatus Omnitrophota bacterium]